MAAPAPKWHPVLAAIEHEPGHWTMTAQYGLVYGTIRLNPGVDYTAEDGRGEHVGRFASLRAAAETLHGRFIRAHGHDGFAPKPWPE